jgi:autotransporter-associated beta strand protein
MKRTCQKYIIALLMLGGLAAQAADYTWTGGGGIPNAWWGANNWDPGVVPTRTDTAIFDASCINYLTINLNGTLNYSLADIYLTSPSDNIVLTNGNTARLGNVDMSAATKDLTVMNTSNNGRIGRGTDTDLTLNAASGRTLTYSALASVLVDKMMTLNLSGVGAVNVEVPNLEMGREQTAAGSPNAVTTLNISNGELSGFTNLRMWGITNIINQTGGLVSVGDGAGGGALVMAQSSTDNGYNNTYNLKGGTLRLEDGAKVTTSLSSGGTTTFVFDGGTLQTTAGVSTYIAGGYVENGIDGVRIDAAGANLDVKNTFSVYPPITGTGGLTKTGPGALYLQANDTYTGETLVNEGTFVVGANGSIDSSVTVADGATMNTQHELALDSQSDLIIGSSGQVNLIFTGTNVINRLSLDGGATWVATGIYGAEQSNIGNTGFLEVTSTPLPSSIMGFASVSNNLMKLVVSAPDAAHTSPKTKADLTSGSWADIAHSDNGINPLVVTNLEYSTAEGTNVAIYVAATNSAAFFGIGPVTP